MESGELLGDGFGRIRGLVERVLAPGLGPDALWWRPDPDANSIGWLLWHLTRVQDNHVSDIAGGEQIWTSDGHADRFVAFGVDPSPANTGYGHDTDQVGAMHPTAEALLAYHEATYDRTMEYLGSLDADELDRIIDTSYDPPVSVGVRLISVLGDSWQHVGQAAYLRGMLERLG